MAKKKTTQDSYDYLAGYVPASYSPNVTTQEIKQIPPYEDTGVSYKGYAKEQRGDSFILNKQQTRFYTAAYTNQASPTTDTIVRSNKDTTVFHCAGILVQYKIDTASLSNYIDLYDGTVSYPRFRVFLFSNAVTSAAHEGHDFFIDLSNCPRKFDGNILIYIPNGLSSGEKFHIELLGWDENR